MEIGGINKKQPNLRGRSAGLSAAAAFLLWLLLLGCAPATPAIPSATAAGPNAISTLPVSLTPMPADTLATLRRSGGVAGATEQSTFKRDGSITAGANVKHAAGGAAAAAALADKIAATGIYDLPPGRYLPLNACCDRQLFELQLSKDGKSYFYAIVEGSAESPKPVLAALSIIQDYTAAAR